MALDKKFYQQVLFHGSHGFSYPMYKLGCTLEDVQEALRYCATLVPVFVEYKEASRYERLEDGLGFVKDFEPKFTCLHVVRNESTDGRGNFTTPPGVRHQELLVEADVAAQSELFVLVVRYYDGDSDGGSGGHFEVEGVFPTLEAAKDRESEIRKGYELEEALDKRDRGLGEVEPRTPEEQEIILNGQSRTKSYTRWNSVFSGLEDVQIHKVPVFDAAPQETK